MTCQTGNRKNQGSLAVKTRVDSANSVETVELLQRIRSEQTLSGPVSCSTPRKTGRSSAVHAGFLEKFLHDSIVLNKDPVYVENELDEI